MAQGNEIEVTDRDGWRKTFPLEKPLIYIGSDARNDIVLAPARGGGVAPRHLQLLSIPGQGTRLVNLGDSDIFLGPHDSDALAPHATAVLTTEVTLSVGEFTLVFRGGGGGGGSLERRSATQAIGVELALPQAQLSPGQAVEGAVTVRNLGDKAGVQFKLEVEGLPPDCYTMGPGPLLFPNAAKVVPFCLRPPAQHTPPAGTYHLVIQATAPEAYPGEMAKVARDIQILPYYFHTLSLVRVAKP